MAPRPTWRCGVASLMGAPPAQGVWGDRPWTRHRAAGKRPAVVRCPRAGWGRGDARVVPHGRGHPSVGLAWRRRPVRRAGNSSRAARRARQGRGRRSTRPWRQDGSCGASPATVGRDHAPRAAPTLMEWRSWRVRHAVRWRAAPAHRRATSRARPSQPAAPRARRPAGLTARPCPRHTRRGLCGCTGPTGGGVGCVQHHLPASGPTARATWAGARQWRAPWNKLRPLTARTPHRRGGRGRHGSSHPRPLPPPPVPASKKEASVAAHRAPSLRVPRPPAGGQPRSASRGAGNGHGLHVPYTRPHGVAVPSHRRRLRGRARHGGNPPPVGRRRRPRPGARQFSFHCRPPVALLW